MTVRMLDGAYPPSDASLRQLYAEGHRVIAGYLPATNGWHPYHVWSKSDFDRCRAAGFALVGIYFGPDAAHALQVADAYGIDTLALDVEANDIGLYAPGVGDAWHGKVHSICYGLRGRISGWAQHFDALWFAEYGAKPATVAPRTAVQWWNSHTDAGAGVDESLADDWFAGGVSQAGNTVAPTGTGVITASPTPAPTEDAALASALPHIYAALISAAYDDIGANAFGGTAAVAPADFQHQVDAALAGSPDVQAVCNNIRATHPQPRNVTDMAKVQAAIAAALALYRDPAVAPLAAEVANLKAEIEPTVHPGGPS